MKALLSLIPLFRAQLKWMLLGVLLSLLTALFGVGLLSLSGWFISISAYVGLISALAWQFNYLLPASGVRFFSLARILGRYSERVVSHQATFKLLTDIRVWFYQKLEPLAPAHLMRFQSGDLLSRMVGDVDALDNLYLRVLVPTVVAIMLTLLVILMFGFFSWQVSVIILISACFTIFAVPLLASYLGKQLASQLALHQSQLKTQAVDYVQGLPELVSYSQQTHCFDRFAEKDTAFMRLQHKMSHISGLRHVLMTVCMGLTTLLVAWVAVRLVNHHHLNGSIIALLVLGTMAWFEVINPLPGAYQYLGQTSTSAKRIIEVVNQTPEVIFPVNKTVELSQFDVVLENIHFAYPEHVPVFQGFDLTIAQGEKLAIVGHTGSGKSTMAHLLSRCWDVQTGAITIGRVPIAQLTEDQLRNAVAVLPQRPHIFNTSIRENLLMANESAREAQLWCALKNAALASFVKTLPHGLDTWVGEQGKALSGGQQKRLALARIFLNPAPIVVLDEPTEGLDRKHAAEVFAALQQWGADKTMILISHQPKQINLMSRVVNLSTGIFL